MTIRALLWDFGDTLADERWMLAPMAGEPAWPTLYRAVLDADGLVGRLDVGKATTAEVARALASRCGSSLDAITAHMRACCRDLRFFPKAMELVRRRALPQALVTVNTEIFTEVVAPHYGLDRHFDAIVTSWQEGTADKAQLCEIARTRLDPNLAPAECLLIDNLPQNIAAWRGRGGAGLHFTGEDALLAAWPL